MTRLLRGSGRIARAGTSVSEYFECVDCQTDFPEWVEDCPECGQLVVRVVDRPG